MATPFPPCPPHPQAALHQVDTFQDFFIAEHIKPCIRILEISISSLNHVIVRPTKTPILADKKCAQF
jgi:hypothetical protein